MTNELFKIFVRGFYKLAGFDSPYSSRTYGPNWSKQRQKCLERDGRECRVCGTSATDLDREPAVHHITPRRQFDEGNWREMNSLSNLITLCPSCHGTHEGKFTDASPEEFAERARRDNT
jgi:5-methylcytosine-specific restriction endonuclease McrA